MSIKVDAKVLLEGIKKVVKVTKASSLNFKFSEGNVRISSVINQYQMELNLPIECQEDMQFCILAETISPVLEGKTVIEFSLENNALKFKSGRAKGELITLPYEEIDITLDNGEELNPAIKEYIFQNLYRVNYTGKNVSSSIPLQIQIKDTKLKMLCMDPYFSGFIEDEVGDAGDTEFKILLSYAVLITEIFKKEDSLKIITTPTSIEMSSPNIKIILPKIAEGESNTIEEMENVIKENVVGEDLNGFIIFKDSKQFLADIDELKTFTGDDPKSKIRFFKSKDSEDCIITVDTQNGKLKKKLDEIKATGAFDSQFNIDNFRTCIEKNIEGHIRLSFYTNFCTIKCDKFKKSIYIVLETK